MVTKQEGAIIWLESLCLNNECYGLRSFREPITFSDENLVSVELSHNDAFIITLNVSKVDITRVLVNIESSCDIIFMSALKMGIDNQ